MHLDLDGNGALYEQLARALKRSVLQGALKAGTRLPATRELAAELRVSRNTVLTAYETLCAESLAVPRRGSGTFVAAAPIAPVAGAVTDSVPAQSRYAARLHALPPIAMRRFGSPVRYDLRYGEPLHDPALVTAWRRALPRAAERSALHYPAANGLQPLREQIAQYVARRRGVVCNAADVVVVNGTQQALTLIARVLLDEGDRVVIEDPHYPFAVHGLRAHGARLVPVSVDAEGLNCTALPRSGVRCVYVSPSHQFPAGVQMSLERRLALLRYADEQSCWIVEDDYDGEFRYASRSTPALRSLDRNGRVIYVGSFSKVLFPALRLGYVISPQSLRDDLIAAKRLDDLGSASIEQAAMAEFMRTGGFDRHLRKAGLELRRRRDALFEGLRRHCGERIRVTDSLAGMHVVGWLPGWTSQDITSLTERARQRGLGLHPIDPYYAKAPRNSGLLLGFAALGPKQLHAATRLLGHCLRDIRP